MEKIFVRYPNFRSSTRNSDPCINSNVYSKCRDCMVFITSDRFLGDEAQKKFAGSLRKHPYVIIADTLGCNLRCWFCYSHHFWSLERAIKHGCNPSFLSFEDLVSQIKCKIEKLFEAEDQMEKKPLMRIRFSGGEPIFATREILRPYDSEKSIDYRLGVDFWIEVFKELDSVILELKNSGKISLINEDEWDFQDNWPVFITDSPGRVNIRFDTNGIAFGNNDESRRVKAEEGLAEYFIDRLYNLHKERKLQNIKVWMDYSFKGVTPNEYFWSQRKNLPSNEKSNNKEYCIDDVPQYSGYKNLLGSIIAKRNIDPNFADCIDITVEKGIDHDRKNKIYLYYPDSMNWSKIEKDLGIELSPVRNDICVVYHYGGGPWGLKKVGPGLIKRYFNQKAELFLSSDEKTLTVRESMSEARDAVNFMFDHNKEENYYAQIYPIADDTEPKEQKKPESIRKKPGQKKKEIKRKVYGWILTGSLINWQTALEHNIWGTHSAHKESWDKLDKGDLLFFYVTKPISGIIGVGITTLKQIGKEPLWADEISVGRIKYPYRWNFKILHILNQEEWNKESISLRGLNIQFFSGINPIFSEKSVEKLRELVRQKWDYNMLAKC